MWSAIPFRSQSPSEIVLPLSETEAQLTVMCAQIVCRAMPLYCYRLLRPWFIVLASLIATCWVGMARAEGNCPPGYYPIGDPAQGSTGCAPLPDNQPDRRNDTGSGQVTPSLGPPLARGWTALVHDAAGTVVVHVTGMKSRREALQAAMTQCRAKGGSECKLDMAIDN